MFKTRRQCGPVDRLAFLAGAPIDVVVPHSRIGHFPVGSIICSADHLADCAYLVLEGRCELRATPSDGASRPTATYRRGDAFGLSRGYHGSDRHALVVAVEDTVVLGIGSDELSGLAALRMGPRGAGVATGHERSGGGLFCGPQHGSLVTLAFMSRDLDGAALSRALAHRLHIETGEPVLRVELAAGQAARGARRAAADWPFRNGASLQDAISQVGDGLFRMSAAVAGASASPEALGGLLRRLQRHFPYVLVQAAVEQVPPSHLFTCVLQSDATHLFLRPEAEDVYQTDLLVHELSPRLNGRVITDIKPVLCLAPSQSVDGFDARLERAGLGPCSLLHECGPLPAEANPAAPRKGAARVFQDDVRRIARGIGRCLVGLALASGGAKGFAHIGVIQVLEEQGIEVDVVVGASMGAYIGALWGCGCDAEQLVRLAREMKGPWALWNLIDPVFPPRQGFLRGFSVKRRLQRTIGHSQFSDLQRPLHVVATNLHTLERTVFSRGDVATAVHASMAVPGICVPVRVGEAAFVDGGIVDPLPADVLQELGVHRIIAVNTIGVPDRLRLQVNARRERAPHRRSGIELTRPLEPITHRLNYFARGNILSILMQSIHGAQIRMAEASCRTAGIVLRPDVQEDRWLDFRNADQHIAAGRDAALEHLARIRELTQPKGSTREHHPSSQPMGTAA